MLERRSQKATQDGRFWRIMLKEYGLKQGPYSIMGQGSSWLWLFRLVEELTIMQRSLPSWVVFWLFVTGVVCTIDGLFIILRPHTLPDGKWNYLVKPCKSNEQSQDWARFPYNNPLNFYSACSSFILCPFFLSQTVNVWGYTEILLVACLRKGRYTRGILLEEHAPGARSGSKAPPCVPTISWVYFILGSRISTPQNAPRYLTG